MYRRTSKYQKLLTKSYTRRVKKEPNLEASVDHQPVSEIPKLRRVIEITDFDSGEPVVHKLELYRTDRIDCYDVYVDGAIWKKRIGWSKILAGIRRAMPRKVRELMSD
jgi:hypothetical protein